MKNGEVTMKTKMSLSAEMDLTQDSVVQLTCWCGQIALHELWGWAAPGLTGSPDGRSCWAARAWLW